MKLHRSLLAGIVLSLAAAVSAQAASVNGSQGFADIGTPTVDTGNIDTATSFTIGDLITTTDIVSWGRWEGRAWVKSKVSRLE